MCFNLSLLCEQFFISPIHLVSLQTRCLTSPVLLHDIVTLSPRLFTVPYAGATRSAHPTAEIKYKYINITEKKCHSGTGMNFLETRNTLVCYRIEDFLKICSENSQNFWRDVMLMDSWSRINNTTLPVFITPI